MSLRCFLAEIVIKNPWYINSMPLKDPATYSGIIAQKFDRNGEPIATKFNPTAKMQLWVTERAKEENLELSDDKLLKKLGWASNTVFRWKEKYDPHFQEWLEEELELADVNGIRAAVERTVARLALSGEVPVLLKYAQSLGVIQPDVVKQEHSFNLPSVETMAKLSDEERARLANSLLAQSRGMGIGGSPTLAGVNPEGEPRSSDARNSQLQGEPVVLLESLDHDGEHRHRGRTDPEISG